MLNKHILVAVDGGYELEEGSLLDDERHGYLNLSDAEEALTIVRNLKLVCPIRKSYSSAQLSDFKSHFNKNKDAINENTKRKYKLGSK